MEDLSDIEDMKDSAAFIGGDRLKSHLWPKCRMAGKGEVLLVSLLRGKLFQFLLDISFLQPLDLDVPVWVSKETCVPSQHSVPAAN